MPTKHGFALVIALSLMAFVLLLLLSVSTLVRVETQSAEISSDVLEARMNAKLGAMIALGDLQRYTGPDQRVTANADIIVAPTDSPLDGQGHWTGVWSSRANPADVVDAMDQLNDRQPVWLVSGENPAASVAVDASNVVALATVGKSVKDKSANSVDDTVHVAAERVIDGDQQISGLYAYWVSDEGVKARVNLPDPYLGSPDTDAEYYRTAVPQQGDATAVSLSDGVQPFIGSDSLWKRPDSQVGRIASLKHIPSFLESVLSSGLDSDELNREFFHDFSVMSKSVLTNTKDGGLRRDLSSALDTSGSLPTDLTGSMFAPVGGTASPGNPGGPKWEQLADYYQLGQTGGSGSVQFRMPTNDQVGIVPVVTRWNFLFNAFAGYRGAPADEWLQSGYEYSLGVFPMITLWNPYDRDLVLPKMGVQAEFPQRAVVRESGNSTVETTGSPILDDSGRWRGGSTNRTVLEFVIEEVTIPAGRAMNFSPPVNSFINLNDPSDNVLVPEASGTLVNGFFTPPVNGVSSADFLENSSGREGWKHKYARAEPTFSIERGSSPIGLFNQVVNLYDLSANSDFDIDGSNRFKSLTFKGMETYMDNVKPRVIRLNRAMSNPWVGLAENPVSLSDAIEPVGASVGASFSLSNINFEEFNDQNLSRRLCGISAVLKFPDIPISSREMKVHLLSHFNPTAPIVTRQVQAKNDFPDDLFSMYTPGEVYNSGYENDTFQNFIDGADFDFSNVGMSNDFSGSDRMVVYELPKAAPLGIGQLMHANLMQLTTNPDNGIPEISNGTYFSGDYGWDGNIQQPYASPTYAIGNSMADPHVPLGQTKIAFTGYSNHSGVALAGAHYDYSYELNDLLWDQFYFSGIDVSAPAFPLPNSRLKRWKSGTSNADLINERQSAAHLLLDGGFNVNSTSVAAWESILGAMREIDTLGEGPSNPDQLHNFARFIEPLVTSPGDLPDITSDRDEIVAGFRNLTDLQIHALAAEIVTQIRLRSSTLDSTGARYPFLSLSQFINRSLDNTTPEFTYKGVVQSAIDQSGLNGDATSADGLWDANYIADYPNYAANDLALEKRPLTESMAGFLTQADILNKIGSILQARSDTFTIRSYGSANESIREGTKSEAYYEIVVQRTPAYVDATDEDYDPATTPTNIQFGRRYEIVSERWLQADEI